MPDDSTSDHRQLQQEKDLRMVTQTPHRQQSRSAAKRIWFAMFILLSIVYSHGQEVSVIAGTWVVRFGNGVDRVYRINPDGSYTSADSGETKEGQILVENGRFIIRLDDGRVQRFTKLSETVLKVEAFGSAEAFRQGRIRTGGTGRLETPRMAVDTNRPAVPAAPSATPVPMPAGQAPQVAPSSRTLVLSPTWNTPMQGGTSTMDDLGKLFGTLTTAKTELTGNDLILIFQDIPYLTPLADAVTKLKITTRLPSKVLVACPGFPKESFYYYAFDGRFEGSFNRLYLVVDRADQVVSVQLVNESPKGEYSAIMRESGWHAYNFVNARTKALSTLRVEHKVAIWSRNQWDAYTGPTRHVPEITQKNKDWTILRLNSQLLKGQDGYFGKAKCLEEVRWYVPRPIVELILRCVQNPGG